MAPVPQSHQNVEMRPAGSRHYWAVVAGRFNVLSRVLPANAGSRRTLNLMLLVVVLPMLLLGVALANFFTSTTFSASEVALVDSQQVDLALESILAQRAQALARAAQDPTLVNAVFADFADDEIDGSIEFRGDSEVGSGGELVRQSLERLWQSNPGFEALALVDAGGQVAATAGILHQDFYLWQNTPAFHDSLNRQGRPSISPLKYNVLSLDEDGNLDLSRSRIDRLVVTAGVPEHAAGSGSYGLMVGIMKSDDLVDSVEKVLRQEPAGSSMPDPLLAKSRETPVSNDVSSSIQLLSDTPEEVTSAWSGPTVRDGPGASGGGPDPAYTGLSPFEESGTSWYSALPSLASQQGRQFLSNKFSLVLAVGSILLAMAAAWFMLRTPGYSEPAMAGLEALVSTADTLAPFTYIDARKASQRLVAVQESVRREMANYLHGHVQSKLVALSMSLGMCRGMLTSEPDQAAILLEQVQVELIKVQDEDLRRVSHELYPAIIKMGLVPAMRSLIDRFNESVETTLIIDADVFGMDQAGEVELPEKQWLGVYRITEEALNNVLKHAHATQIEVNLICDVMGNLVLSVKDDGCGFDPEASLDSPGLSMMADYATAIGGRASINSTLQKGTTLSLTVVMDPPRQRA